VTVHNIEQNNTRENQETCRPCLASSRHVLHQLQLVEVDAGQANDIIKTKESQGLSAVYGSRNSTWIQAGL